MMVRLTKEKIFQLKSTGQWIEDDVSTYSYAQVADAKAFGLVVSGPAVETDPLRPMTFTPSIKGLTDFFACAVSTVSYDQLVDLYGGGTLGPYQYFYAAIFFNLSQRVLDTSQLQQVSNTHSIPTVGLPDHVLTLISSFGAMRWGSCIVQFSDAGSIAKSFLWAGCRILSGVSFEVVLDQFWVPVSCSDAKFRHILADKLGTYLLGHEENGDLVDLMRSALFSGLVPSELNLWYESLDAGVIESICKMFFTYKDAPHFVKFFGSTSETATLMTLLGFKSLPSSADEMCWRFSFRDLCCKATREVSLHVGVRTRDILSDVKLIRSKSGSPSQFIDVCDNKISCALGSVSFEHILTAQFGFSASHCRAINLRNYAVSVPLPIVTIADLDSALETPSGFATTSELSPLSFANDS